MTPEEYLAICDREDAIIGKAEARKDAARSQANECPLPASLRPAEPRDIVVGQIIWKPDWEHSKWAVVERVLYPDDDFKAFEFEGARYGLHRAFVEVKDAEKL